MIGNLLIGQDEELRQLDDPGLERVSPALLGWYALAKNARDHGNELEARYCEKQAALLISISSTPRFLIVKKEAPQSNDVSSGSTEAERTKTCAEKAGELVLSHFLYGLAIIENPETPFNLGEENEL